MDCDEPAPPHWLLSIESACKLILGFPLAFVHNFGQMSKTVAYFKSYIVLSPGPVDDVDGTHSCALFLPK